MKLGEGEVMVVRKKWPVWFATGGQKEKLIGPSSNPSLCRM
jgi:hypothetical protein